MNFSQKVYFGKKHFSEKNAILFHENAHKMKDTE